MSVGVFDWGDVCGAVDNFGIYVMSMGVIVVV